MTGIERLKARSQGDFARLGLYCADMAVVTVLVRPFTVHIHSFEAAKGRSEFIPTCSCGWQDVIVYSQHQWAKGALREHMLTFHATNNMEHVVRLER